METKDDKAVCPVCPHHCVLAMGETGACRVRKHTGDGIIPLNYGVASSLALDPIEKKPLARFMPGSKILSVGSYGCNMRCAFCQNHEISQIGADTAWDPDHIITPEELVDTAVRYRESHGNIGIAYTYNEPLIAYEYVRDCSKLAREKGLVNVIVTNGMAEASIMDKILPYTDALNIDLKAFTDEAYRRMGGDLDTVKQNIKRAALLAHVEVTSLIVPGINDNVLDMDREAAWLSEMDRDIPLHITRFFPMYRMRGAEPTDLRLMYRLRDVAGKYLKYVYLGNI